MKKRKNGYNQSFKHNISCGDYGVPGECIEWCRKNCKGNWGWWFETTDEWAQHWDPTNNMAYMSFSHKKDAVRFWFENLRELEECKENK